MNRTLAAAAIALAGAAARPPTESERIQALPEEDRRWLTEYVAPIILPEEKRVFLELAAPYQRETFKAGFWERREREGLAFPLGPGYRFRYVELRKLADEKYDGWRQDAGRMVIRWGEPAVILSPRCPDENVFYDLEVWTYRGSSAAPGGSMLSSAVRYILYRPAFNAPRKLWSVIDESVDPASERSSVKFLSVQSFEPSFQPNNCRSSMRQLAVDCDSGDRRCGPCADRCEVHRAYLEIRSRQDSRSGALTEQARLFEPQKVSTEGIEHIREKWAASADPNAKPIRLEGPSSPPSTPTPAADPVRVLSDEEIRDRILRLEPKYRDWLDYAGPLLTREQLSRFLQLSSAEKDRFLRDFFKKQK